MKRKMIYMKQKRNKRLSKLLFIFFFIISLVIYFNSSISKITQIEIIGLNILSEEEVYKQGEINHGMQYLFLSPAKVSDKLLEGSKIKEVLVKKHFPGKLKIDITENKIIAYLHHSNKEWLPILENGYIMNSSKNTSYINRPLITNWPKEEKITLLATELTKVQPVILEEISEIQYNHVQLEQDRLLLYTKDGYTIHVNLLDLGNKLNLLPNIIDQLKEKNYPVGEIYLLDSIRFEEYKHNEVIENEG